MRAALLVLAAILLSGCSSVQPLVEVSPSLTTLPMPSGATEVASAFGAAVESCDATASLRPSTEAGPAVAAIRQRGRKPVRPDPAGKHRSGHRGTAFLSLGPAHGRTNRAPPSASTMS